MIRLLATAVLAVALPAFAATEKRDVGAFNAFTLSAPIDVHLALGERDSVALEGDEKLIARLEAVVERGVLHLRLKREDSWTWNLGWDERVRARVTARRLETVVIAGAGDVRIAELRGEQVRLSVAGSGDIQVGGGKVADLRVDIAGSGDIRTPRLEAERVNVSISGSGDATVWARRSLDVQVAGSGDVKFYGDPSVTSRVVGSGDVRRLGGAPG